MFRSHGILIVLTLLISGCGGSTPESDGDDNRVVIGGSTWYAHLPAIYGVETGIFKKHGFDVEFRPVGTSSDRIKAISSGTVQFASLGQIAMLTQMANGNKSFYWVGNQDIAPGFEGVVAAPGITSFSQLKGKKIGLVIASSVEITVYQLLGQNGMTSSDVKLVPLKPNQITTAMKTGSIDAGAVWEPHFSRIKAIEGATVLGLDTDTDIYKTYKTMTGPDVLVIGRSWVDANPERARRFMKAYWEAVDAVRADPQGALNAIFDRWFKDPEARPVLEKNLTKFVWLTLADQKKVFSNDGLYKQTDEVLRILKDEIGKIHELPKFREWVNTDILPFE